MSSSTFFESNVATSHVDGCGNADLVVIYGKNGISFDQKGLENLIEEKSVSSISVIRLTSPTPSMKDEESEAEKIDEELRKIDLGSSAESSQSDNDFDSEDERNEKRDTEDFSEVDSSSVDSESSLEGEKSRSRRIRRKMNFKKQEKKSKPKMKREKPSVVGLKMEEFYTGNEAKELLRTALKMAGVVPVKKTAEHDLLLYVIKNDHNYTPFTSPEQMKSKLEADKEANKDVQKARRLSTHSPVKVNMVKKKPLPQKLFKQVFAKPDSKCMSSSVVKINDDSNDQSNDDFVGEKEVLLTLEKEISDKEDIMNKFNAQNITTENKRPAELRFFSDTNAAPEQNSLERNITVERSVINDRNILPERTATVSEGNNLLGQNLAAQTNSTPGKSSSIEKKIFKDINHVPEINFMSERNIALERNLAVEQNLVSEKNVGTGEYVAVERNLGSERNIVVERNVAVERNLPTERNFKSIRNISNEINFPPGRNIPEINLTTGRNISNEVNPTTARNVSNEINTTIGRNSSNEINFTTGRNIVNEINLTTGRNISNEINITAERNIPNDINLSAVRNHTAARNILADGNATADKNCAPERNIIIARNTFTNIDRDNNLGLGVSNRINANQPNIRPINKTIFPNKVLVVKKPEVKIVSSFSSDEVQSPQPVKVVHIENLTRTPSIVKTIPFNSNSQIISYSNKTTPVDTKPNSQSSQIKSPMSTKIISIQKLVSSPAAPRAPTQSTQSVKQIDLNKKVKSSPKGVFTNIVSLIDEEHRVENEQISVPTTPKAATNFSQIPKTPSKGFTPLVLEAAVNNQLPSQISVQTHQSSSEIAAENDKQLDLIDLIVQDEMKNSSNLSLPETPHPNKDIPKLVKMLESTEKALQNAEKIHTNENIELMRNTFDNTPTDVLPDDLFQHVVNLIEEDKTLKEAVEKQVFGAEPVETSIRPTSPPPLAPIRTQNTIPPLASTNNRSIIQIMTSNDVPPKSSVEYNPEPNTLYGRNAQNVRNEPIQIVRHGKVITLPPIEAPTTRAKRRAQTQPASSQKKNLSSPKEVDMNVSLQSNTSTDYEKLSEKLPMTPTSRRSSKETTNLNKNKRKSSGARRSRKGRANRSRTEAEASESQDDDDPKKLWCICRQPHNNRFMICCDTCEDWYHGTCVNVTKAMGIEMEQKKIDWKCPKCVQKQAEKNQLKITDMLITKGSPTPTDTQIVKNANSSNRIPFHITGSPQTPPPASVRAPSPPGSNVTHITSTPHRPKVERKPVVQKTNATSAKIEEANTDNNLKVCTSQVSSKVSVTPTPSDTPKPKKPVIEIKSVQTGQFVTLEELEQLKRTTPTRCGKLLVNASSPIPDNLQVNKESAVLDRSTPKLSTKFEPNKSLHHSHIKVQKAIPMSSLISGNSNEYASKCVVCKKAAKEKSVYCTDDCLNRYVRNVTHQVQVNNTSAPTGFDPEKKKKTKGLFEDLLSMADRKPKVERLNVVERKSGKIISGHNAPTLTHLKKWLQENPSYEVILPGSPQALEIEKKNRQKLQQCTISTHYTTTKPPTNSVQKNPTTSILHSNNSLQRNTMNMTINHSNSNTGNMNLNSANLMSKKPLVLSPLNTTSVVEKTTTETLSPKSTLPTPTTSKVQQRQQQHQHYHQQQQPQSLKAYPQKVMIRPDNRHDSKEENKATDQKSVKKSINEKVSATTKKPSTISSEPIRTTVQRTFKEQLQFRIKEYKNALEKNTNISEEEMVLDLNKEEIEQFEEELDNFVTNVELEMYNHFSKDTGNKYRAKYRSLMFNIKDRKNLTLFKKICSKLIDAKQLVKMSAEELASQELARWRENETKHQLEMIKKSELEILSCNRNYVVKTHKGEEVIEEKSINENVDINLPLDQVVSMFTKESENANEAFAKRNRKKSISPDLEYLNTASASLDNSTRSQPTDVCEDVSKINKKDYEKDHEHHKRQHEKTKHKSKDHHKSKSKSHKRSRSASRSRSRSKSREKRHKNSHSSREKESHNNYHHEKDKSKLNVDYEGSERMEKKTHVGTIPHSTSKDLLMESLKEKQASVKKMPINKSLNAFNIVDKILESTKTVEEAANLVHEKEEKAPTESQPHIYHLHQKISEKFYSDSDQEPSSTVSIATPPQDPYIRYYGIDSPLMGKDYLGSIWSRRIHMIDVATFHTTVQPLSSNSLDLNQLIPKELEVVGRIVPDTVWDYVSKIKKSPNKEIALVRFIPSSESNTSQYIELYQYLDNRNRLGVIKSILPQIRDFYIYPLGSNKDLPAILQPIENKEFFNDPYRPDILIGILVRVHLKRPISQKVNPPPLLKTKSHGSPSGSPKRKKRKDLSFLKSDIDLDAIIKAPMVSKSHMKPSCPPVTIPATDADEPYSPGSSPDGNNATIPNNKMANVTSLPNTGDEDLKRKMEELNRQIAVQEMEIAGLLNVEHSSNVLANISIPPDLSKILASIQPKQTNLDKSQKNLNLATLPSSVASLRSNQQNNAEYDPERIYDAQTQPLSKQTSSSRLAQLTEAELLSMVPDDLLVTTTLSQSSEEPPPPGV